MGENPSPFGGYEFTCPEMAKEKARIQGVGVCQNRDNSDWHVENPENHNRTVAEPYSKAVIFP